MDYFNGLYKSDRHRELKLDWQIVSLWIQTLERAAAIGDKKAIDAAIKCIKEKSDVLAHKAFELADLLEMPHSTSSNSSSASAEMEKILENVSNENKSEIQIAGENKNKQTEAKRRHAFSKAN